MASNASVLRRQAQIVEIVNKRGIISVEELSEALEVAAITIRRDLDKLVAAGSVLRRHGSAVSLTYQNGLSPEKKLVEKDVLYMEEKMRIAQKACSLIGDDEILFMNSGSTTLCFLRALKDKRVKIITNNAAAITEKYSPLIELLVLGGEYREQSQSLVGEFALDSIRKIYSDHTILGTNGISLEKGLTTSVFQECSINEAMIEHTHGKVIVLADSSKMGKIANFVSSPLSKIDTIITDKNCPEAFKSSLEALGIEVVLA